MIDNSKREIDASEQKRRIRERYKGIDISELDIIPALPQAGFYDDSSLKRVAVYARVSTDDLNQTSSYELQRNHYQDIIAQHQNWKLVDIYADEGISGTSLAHRDEFKRMMNDCDAGKIDLILTKSVSRFARNVLISIGCIRKLKERNPPIGIFFESENIYSLNSNSEMSLSFIATLAQEESHNKSDIMNASIEMRFRRGIFLTPVLLGYDHDEDGSLIVNENEASTVRLIFFMYLYGYTCNQIAEILTRLKRTTKKGSSTWAASSILQILQNERYCGDVLARKTYTPNYLDHKSRKNDRARNQYRRQNNHEAIIERDDFFAVQKLIRNARFGSRGLLPKLQVVPNGILKGFVSINPRWAGFKPEDYYDASNSVFPDEAFSEILQIEVHSGEFDYRGYEVARAQFFSMSNRITAAFSSKNIYFNSEAVRKLPENNFVEMLIHPSLKLLAIRPVRPNSKNSVQWSKKKKGTIVPRDISGASFLPCIFSLLGWNEKNKYKLIGIKKQRENETLLIYDLCEAEVHMADPSDNPTDNEIVGYPKAWGDTFGQEFYNHDTAPGRPKFDLENVWNSDNPTAPFDVHKLNLTSRTELENNIRRLISDMEKENTNESDA